MFVPIWISLVRRTAPVSGILLADPTVGERLRVWMGPTTCMVSTPIVRVLRGDDTIYVDTKNNRYRIDLVARGSGVDKRAVPRPFT